MQKDKVIFVEEWKCCFKASNCTSGSWVPHNVPDTSFLSGVDSWWVLLQQPARFFIPKCLFITSPSCFWN